MNGGQEYIISDDELKQLQRIQLEMLIEFDRICRSHGIQYSLDGGTLLGAVRHKGFIPWDDDIDVIMLRHEYAKFRRACQKDLDRKRFFLQDYRSDPYYRWGYAKLRRKGTEHIRLGQECLRQKTGIFMDIFVVDQVPDSYILRRLHHLACFCIRKVLYAPVGEINAAHRGVRNWYHLLSYIPRDWVFHFRNLVAFYSNKHKTQLISHYTLEYPKRCRYGLPRSCFDQFVELEFEGRMMRAFADYDTYLTMYYGNYMELPPENERVAHLKVSKLKLIDVDVWDAQ